MRAKLVQNISRKHGKKKVHPFEPNVDFIGKPCLRFTNTVLFSLSSNDDVWWLCGLKVCGLATYGLVTRFVFPPRVPSLCRVLVLLPTRA